MLRLVRKLFRFSNYLHVLHLLQRKGKIKALETQKFSGVDLRNIWEVTVPNNIGDTPQWSSSLAKFPNSENPEWHLDDESGFRFPLTRFDKLNFNSFADAGIDIKVPWEKSRFYFGIKLAEKYSHSKDISHYNSFKALVLNWIDANPFMCGINWGNAMEVSIRASQWLVSVHIFGKVFWDDNDFKDFLSAELIKHATYISEFPEYISHNKTTNHTVADFTGLLLLAIALSDHPDSGKWLRQATKGLSHCCEQQVNEDGMHMEGSVPYHGFVTECLALAAIAAAHNKISLPANFLATLEKMFRFTETYLDSNMNAPMVGDNDSGRFLQLGDSPAGNHGYLLKLAQLVFGEDFLAKEMADISEYAWLPSIKAYDFTTTSAHFSGLYSYPNAGAYIFKNAYYRVFIPIFPIGMHGQGGHNHIDVGSFDCSVAGKPVIVDCGTFTYTRSLQERQKYRSPGMHNFILAEEETDDQFSTSFWDVRNFPTVKDIQQSDNQLKITVATIGGIEKTRTYQFEDQALIIRDHCTSPATSNFHLAPEVTLAVNADDEWAGDAIAIKCKGEILTEEYQYAPEYNRRVPAQKVKVVLQPDQELELMITFA